MRPGKVSSVVVVLIDGLGYSDYTDNKECFPYITETFKTVSYLTFQLISINDIGFIFFDFNCLSRADKKIILTKSCVP